MTTVTAAPPNPTVSDARRAAAELANAGVSRVLLFGSVAQGKAKVGSDIDLVAMFDDIDYSQRRELRSSLCTAAEAVVQPGVAALAPRIAGAAVAVAAIVTDEMAAHSPDAGAVVRARRIVQQVSKILNTHDLLTGKQTGGDTS